MDEMLGKVKAVLGLTSDETDPLLTVMCQDARDAVKDYCNRTSFPSQLEYVARELVVKAFKQDNEGNVSSIKRGDMQITYASAIGTDCFTERQICAMNRYRKMRVG